MSLVLCAVDSSLPAPSLLPQLLFISIFACAREAWMLPLASPAGSEALPGSQASTPFPFGERGGGSMVICLCGPRSVMAQGSDCKSHILALPLKLTL